MKFSATLLLLIGMQVASAQEQGVHAKHQVDSLIQVSRDFTAKGEYNLAMEVNAVAEKTALDSFGYTSAAYGRCAFNRGRVYHFKNDIPEAEKWYLLSMDIFKKTLGRVNSDYAGILNNLASLYLGMGNFEKSEPLFLECIEIQKQVLGAEHPAYASSLNNLASLYMNLGNFEKSEPLFLECKEIHKKVFGVEHPDYAESLNNLAIFYWNKGELERSLSLFIEVKDIRKKALGTEHLDYSNSLNALGLLYSAMGDFGKVEPLYLECKEIRMKVLGTGHMDYAIILGNLAILYLNIGRFDEAEPLFLECIAIKKSVIGTAHPDYASTLNNLAVLYSSMGIYEKVEPLYLESIEIRRAALGTEHPDYAQGLNNLAILYWSMGQYEKAEPFYIESKEIRKRVLGTEHPDYIQSLHNLGNLYFSMGDFERAESLYCQSTEGRKKVMGPEHPDYASSLHNLATLYLAKGSYVKAEELYLEAIGVLRMVFGSEHSDYAQGLNNLASLYKIMGNFEKAQSLYTEAADVRKKVLGEMHPDYAQSLRHLAALYTDMGDFEAAEPLYIQSIAICKRVLGSEHPHYASTLISLATHLEKTHRFKDSELLFSESTALVMSRLVNSTFFLSEIELGKYQSLYASSNSLIPSIALARLAVDSIHDAGLLPSIIYDQMLFHKGFLLNAGIRLRQLDSNSPKAKEVKQRLNGYRRRLAVEYSKSIVERKGITKLEEKVNQAEKELSRTVAGYAEAIQQVKWREVHSKLSVNEAILEFVHFNVNFPQGTDSIMYAVLMLTPGNGGPQFIPLFEEKELEYFLSANKERKADYVNDLYTWADRGMVQLGSKKKSLYDLIWARIESAGLDGISTIYYSPSGILHRLNLGAIAVDEETILSDKYNLVALNSTRQLVIPNALNPHANEAVLVGGVDFEADSIHTSMEEKPLLVSRAMAEAWTESDTRGGSWNYLKWTEREVERISSTLTGGGFDVARWSGNKATEEVIKAIGFDAPSPRILHFATHGFFFPDPERTISDRGRMPYDSTAIERTTNASTLNLFFETENEPVFKWSDNPMIRSGLILAGGNYAWQNGRAPRPDMEDGILTAYEISQMNLSNTELVVLSACETGLGDIQGNEGVYGLQRAFKIAGAKYLIMSLWQVPDRETMEFMTTFYKNWLEGKMTIPDAFRKTQREMRDRFFNPYSWAGFVLVE